VEAAAVAAIEESAMNEKLTIDVRMESDATMALLRELRAAFVEKALDFTYLPSELVRVETDVSAARADVIVMRLEPTDRLMDLLAAARAGKLERLCVEKS
jgi:hypothetical protein